MKFSSRESIKAIEQAQYREKEAVDLYERCFESAANEGVRTILRMLAAEEQKHYRIMVQLAADAQTDNLPAVDTGTGESAREVFDKAFAHISMSDFTADGAGIDELLVQALENEKESFNLYSSLADSSESMETAAVFQYLAAEENKHYIMVSNMLNFLGDPGRWLYEEENLIFRRG